MNNKYIMCIDNSNYLVSLTLHKVYKVIADESAAAHGWVRLVDDTEESYLFPIRRFVEVTIPQEAEASFALAVAA
jgi:hypothetical protein